MFSGHSNSFHVLQSVGHFECELFTLLRKSWKYSRCEGHGVTLKLPTDEKHSLKFVHFSFLTIPRESLGFVYKRTKARTKSAIKIRTPEKAGLIRQFLTGDKLAGGKKNFFRKRRQKYARDPSQVKNGKNESDDFRRDDIFVF